VTWYASRLLDGTIFILATPPATHSQKVGMKSAVFWRITRRRVVMLECFESGEERDSNSCATCISHTNFTSNHPAEYLFTPGARHSRGNGTFAKTRVLVCHAGQSYLTYLTPTNALIYICSSNLLRSAYMFRRYIMPSSGS
jgi:hypothetical protein